MPTKDHGSINQTVSDLVSAVNGEAGTGIANAALPANVAVGSLTVQSGSGPYSVFPGLLAGQCAASGGFFEWGGGGGVWDVHSPANPSFAALGTADETAAWNAAVVAANASGAGIVRGKPGYIYKLKRKSVGVQDGGGISLLPGVSLWGYGVTLEMDDNTQHITNLDPAPFGSGTVATITADVTTGDATFTVDSSAGFTIGDEVFVRLGQNPYDAAESVFWMWAKVLLIPDGTHLTLDRPGMVTFVAATTATISKQISKAVGAVSNAFIAGFTLTQGAGGNVEEAIFLRKVRNFSLLDLKTTDPGPGIMCWYSHNITGRNYWCTRSIKQGGQASKGRAINIAGCVNVDWQNLRVENVENSVTFVENFSRNIKFKNIFVNNNNPNRVANTALFFVGQGSECYHEEVEIEGTGANTVLVDVGGTTGNIVRFRNLTVDIAPNWVAGPDLRDVEGTLRIKSQPAALVGDYFEVKRYSKTIAVPINAAPVQIPLPNGLYRRLKIFINDKTGLTALYIAGVSNSNDVSGALVAGQLVDVMPTAGGITWGTNTPWINAGTTGRGVIFNTTAAVPATAYIVVEIEYFTTLVNDGSNGYAEDPGSKWLTGSMAASKDFQRSRQAPTEAVLVSGVDATAGELVGVTITAARVVGAPLNPAIGQRLIFTFIQGGAGAFAITWNAVFKKTWADTGNATNARSSIEFQYDGANWNQTSAQAPYV